jgi:23S rRNA pseudouridine2605 synthase
LESFTKPRSAVSCKGNMRLNKFLASCGLGSRRSSESLITDGRVAVNGKVVRNLGTAVVPDRDEVRVDGEVVSLPRKHTYYLLHKPVDVVCTAHDPQGRVTVMTLVPGVPRVFPVGRLDQDSSGALLLTDDGALAHRISHPRYEIDKEYEVVAAGAVEDAALDRLRGGVHLPDEARPTAPAGVEVVQRVPQRSCLRIVLHEGRKRQVRRMLEAVGHPVLQLQRIRIGPVALGDLEPGAFRELTAGEVTALRRITEVKRVKETGTVRDPETGTRD